MHTRAPTCFSACLSALAAAALLVACGGGHQGDAAPAESAVQSAQSAPSAPADSSSLSADTPHSIDAIRRRESGSNGRTMKGQAISTSLAIPADAHVKGLWSQVYDWPLVAIHSVLMPDGRVMTYGTDTTGRQTGKLVYDLWDSQRPPDSGHLTLPNGTITDIFCSSQLLLPQTGEVFIAGGDNWTGTATTNTGNNNSNLFSPATNTLSPGPNMNRARWYSSSLTLLNGETYVQGGTGGADRPEIRGADGRFRVLSGVNTYGFTALFPRNFVAPNGRIFGYDTSGRMYWVDPTVMANGVNVGSVATAGQLAANYVGWTSSNAMFRPGRILQFGGNSNSAVVIDITSGSPVVTPTSSMSSQRQWVNATLLPDGKVLATSGSQTENQLVGVNNIAEIWDPQTGQWSQGSAGVQPRLYHSNALLLPDGSVLVSGGGAPAPVTNLNAEIYYPPYLFNAAGERAARPAITATPDWLEIGKTFSVGVNIGSVGAASVSRVTLVKTGSVTHSFNMEQRFLDLTFKAGPAGVTVQAPTHAGEAPPGYYQLFVFNEAGVPSVASIVRMGVAANPDPAILPTLASPGAQASVIGYATSLALAGTDPNGDTLSFSATALPPGLAIDATSGAVSGTPTANGSYDTVVTVSDGINATSIGFVWTVTPPLPLTLETPAAPAPVLANGNAAFTATASGSVLRYRWSFGDGTPVSAWSTLPTASHVYTSAGLFTVTVSVMDGGGNQTSRSTTQAVYLPATVGRPSASSNLLVERPTGGNARLWVVNQDNDSVSAFDAVSRAKLGEVAVGAAPRSIALAATGLLWVTNKQSASISVIDPATRAVTRTIALPRGSQPFGVAMSPGGTQAFVALEASGRLLKFDSASYAQTGSLAVGPNVRHVSVSGDGASVYVPRFITPPLPGEGTATVSTPATVGGEIVVVNAGAMSAGQIIVLRHSDKPDFENQGRGIPNYLGALAISPDGTQAWAPSKQDNVKRGTLRDGNGLNFQSTVRAISSRIVMASGTEDYARRIDHDNASVASAAVFEPRGNYLFVALETSREVAVIDAFGGAERMRFNVGRAPQGLAISADGTQLYVNNFMDRTLGVFDLRPLLQQGLLSVPAIATLASVGAEKLTAPVLSGKQFFYDALDTRLARDRYMSCATCHNDGGQDGRVWDMTGQGEGLRNTIALRGRAGAQGLLHWSANFDEVQDFEGQIRTLAGGTGLMTDAAFATGTRSQPLGDKKTGLSADLDALAAYVSSLKTFDASPNRPSATTLSSAATAGRAIFQSQNCAACHGGTAFSNSGLSAPMDIGTLKSSSGSRLGGPLTGIDIPTLRDVWASAPYLHDGSAATLDAAVTAHKGVALAAADLSSLSAYLREIGAEEGASLGTTAVGAGSGLTGSYFNNPTLSGTPALTRNEVVDLDWGTASPGSGVKADGFSVRWTGKVLALTSGPHLFRTVSDDGVRLWIDNVLVIDNWTDHVPATDTSLAVMLSAGKQVDVRMDYYERGGLATARLQWQPPGGTGFVAVPAAQLYPSAAPVAGSGLIGSYFNNATLSGSAVLTRSEAVDFSWGAASPGSGVNADNFSVRWTGTLTAPASGNYAFQTVSDDGVRVSVNGTRVIDNWSDHSATTNTSGTVRLSAGQRYSISIEYYDRTGTATISTRWRTPGASGYVAIPRSALNPN